MGRFRKTFAVLIAVAAFVMFAGESLASIVEAETAKNVRWRGRVIKLGLSTSFLSENPAIKTGSDVRGAFARSLESWENAANVRFEVFDSPRQNVSPAGTSGDGINLLTIAGSAENVLFVGKGDLGLPAATRVFFDRKGNITESDIVLNPAEQFSTDGTFGTFDLESVFVHEIGHLLGLPHIELPGATMHDNVPRNGLYGLSYLRSRTLTKTDISAARSIYGEPDETLDCCGSLLATVTMPNGRPARQFSVYLESTDDGRVYGLGKTDNAGKVEFRSLPAGNYRIAAAGSKTNTPLFSEEIEVATDEQAVTSFVVAAPNAATDRFLIGFNGQLSSAPLPLRAGGVSRIYLAVPENFLAALRIDSASSNVTVVRDSFSENFDYDGLRVISFEVEIDPDAADGEYSLVVRSDDFGSAYLPGIISIDRRFELAQQPRRIFD
jgi:hypothetical protein